MVVGYESICLAFVPVPSPPTLMMQEENFGQTFEKQMADRIAGLFMHMVRGLVALTKEDLGEAQHRLGVASKNLTDIQGDISDEITRRRKGRRLITDTKPDPSISMVLEKGRRRKNGS